MERKVYISNTPVDEAQRIFFTALEKCSYFNIDTEEIDVFAAQGRILSNAVMAKRSSPHYVASAMDGIAVKSSSTFAANESNPINLIKNKDYIEVDTGDYVPREFDSVIMIEDVNFTDDYAQIIKPAVPWQHIRSVGEDLVAEDMIVPSFTRIGAEEIGSFLTGAVNKVSVVKKPIVAIIPTGTELVNLGSENMAPGEIVESNSRVLGGLCLEWGADYVRHDIVLDDKEKLKQAVNEVKDQADMIVICSGSSAGKEDYTASIVEELGELLIHGIATRPGKPAILGIIDNKPVIGVPGYPVSAHLIFHLFAKPVLYKKQGIPLPEPDILPCRISRKLASHMGVDEYIYVNTAKVKDTYVAYPLNRGAGITTSLVKADGLLHIPRGNEGVQAGETCNIILKRSRQSIDNTLVCIGSHDMTIDYLNDLLQINKGMRLVSSNVGSMGGIMSLKRQETHFSGIHLLDTHTGDYNVSYLKKYLPEHKWLLINLVEREQGFIVKKDNPLKIQEIKDLLQPNIRFINRQKGAGTRVLFDYLLQKENIDPSCINGYNREEYTHLAVAASVKNDACDTGLGIYASAKALGLHFIPVTRERYDLCIMADLVTDQNLNILLETISSKEFKKKVESFGGYSLRYSGQILYSNNL